jgi:protoporphyrinogen IX oxidase
MTYFWFKAFHIVGVVSWFAGLFYLARLFIYHVEANGEPEPARSILKKQYGLMEKRLLNIITTPAMVLAVVCAIGLLVTEPAFLKQGWMHAKLAFVALLLGYHFFCIRLMKQLEAGTCRWSAQQLRGLNEAPTVLLVVIVLLVVFKDNFPTSATVWVIFGMVVAMLVTIQLYARKRRLDKEKLLDSASEPSI